MKCLLLLGAVALAYGKNDDLMRIMFMDSGCKKGTCIGGCVSRGKIVSGSYCTPTYRSGVAMSWQSMTTLTKMMSGMGYNHYSSASKYVTGTVQSVCATALKFEEHERKTMTKSKKSVCFKSDNGKEFGYWPNLNKMVNVGARWTESNFRSVAKETNTVPACLSWLALSTDMWGACVESIDNQSFNDKAGSKSKYSLYTQMAKITATARVANQQLAGVRSKLAAMQKAHKQVLEVEKKVTMQYESCEESHKKVLSSDTLNDFRYRMESIYAMTRDEWYSSSTTNGRDIYWSKGGSDDSDNTAADVWWLANRAQKF